MPSYKSAVAFIAAVTSMNLYSHAFTSPKISHPSKKNVSKPFGVPVASMNNFASSTALKMGVMEDFLAGTDNEKRKVENEKYVSGIEKRVAKINALEASVEDLGDDEMQAKTEEFRKRLQNGEDINGPIMEEAFAVVREAAW